MPDRITYVGHATTLIELGGVRLLTDPLLRDRFLIAKRAVPTPPAEAAENIDAVLLSHGHGDHLDIPSIRTLGDHVRKIAPDGATATLRRRGFDAVTEVEAGDSTTVGEVEVRAIRAIHDGRRFKLGPKADSLGYLVRGPRTSVYFAGDTDLFDEMAELAGEVDVALLPIGGWGSSVGRGHLDPRRAAEAAAVIRPRIVIPIHWGTYLRADLLRSDPEVLTRYPPRFERELRRRAPGVDLRILRPGEALALE